MPLIQKPNYNQIFASQAPEQDKPAVFNNYPEGWGPESRPNNGKPTIKGFNYLQQTSDLKDLWILQNGACLPYDESIEYVEGAPVLKDGVIQYKTAGGFVNALKTHNDLDGRDAAGSHPASAILDESGLSQQQINTSNARLTGNVLDYFTKSELEAWSMDQEGFDASDAIIRAQTLASSAEINFPSGVFRVTKAIPSTKTWRGVRGGYAKRGTHIVVDNPVAINPVIDCTALNAAIELHDIHFEDKQVRKHTLLKEGVYQGLYTGTRIDRFNVGIETSGTYAYFEDCYIMGNSIGIKPRATNDVGNANSTMFGCTRCFFIYNDVAYDIPDFGAPEELINVPFISCGFELNRRGLNSPSRTWYLTLLNCWFEANSEYGLYAPTSHVIEINTRHNENSPKAVDPKNYTQILGMTATFPKINAAILDVSEVQSNIGFAGKYFGSNTEPQNGASISQALNDDAGTSVAKIEFRRSPAGGSSGGSNIVFSTQATSASGELLDRWIVDRFGSLKPVSDNTYQLGSAESRVSKVFTTRVMYTETCGDFFGSGSPEGVVVASKGSTYRKVDGGSPSFYVKESDTGSTGWVGK